MRLRATLLAAAVSLGVAACGNESPSSPNSPAPKVGASDASSVASQSTVSAAQADRTSPPAGTPPTHAGTPQPEAAPAPTARDTSANQPMGDLTKSKESSSLPLAGQVNNHSSPATDRPNKTTPEGGGPAAKQ